MEHSWTPVDADCDGLNFQITYRNELGEEHIHSSETQGIDHRLLCWKKCRGDWPACMDACPAIKLIWEREEEERSHSKPVRSEDPFNFMLNCDCFIDDHNCYVERFDTVDGTHWEIAVDIGDKILDLLDEETQ